MNVEEKKQRGRDVVQPSQMRLEDAAIAVLIERIARLDAEAKDDLLAVIMEIKDCTNEEQLREIERTAREIIYPQLAGNLIIGKAGNAQDHGKLQSWSKSIGNRIKELRLSKDLTQEQLAKTARLPQSHISRLENGEHSPSHKTVVAIASALGVPIKAIDPASND